MQVKKQQLELDMEQQTGSKSGKEYVKAEYCHPAYLTYMHSTSGLLSAVLFASVQISWNPQLDVLFFFFFAVADLTVVSYGILCMERNSKTFF